MRIFDRLNVNLLGKRLHRERQVEKQYQRRLEESIERTKQRIEIPDHTRVEKHKMRPARKRVSAEPNTPLLKRLVKSPQVLDVVRFSKIKSEKALPERRPERSSFAEVSVQRRKTAKNRGLVRHRAMDLYIKAETVQIPSVDSWLKQYKRSE
ncbi:MAG: hypothetical protein CMK59_06170 [Proteobacteria bacterium]|nr:hypothetical protein [Pseudomonadota bacterium]